MISVLELTMSAFSIFDYYVAPQLTEQNRRFICNKGPRPKIHNIQVYKIRTINEVCPLDILSHKVNFPYFRETC